jgi:hypothetical protein
VLQHVSRPLPLLRPCPSLALQSHTAGGVGGDATRTQYNAKECVSVCVRFAYS